MKNSIAATTVVALASLCPPSNAEYSAEVFLGYENLDANFSGEDLYLGGVTLYTQPLNYLGRTPYDEAPFFNQVGMVDMVYGRVTGFDENYDNYGVAYTHRSAQSPHGFTAAWFHTDLFEDTNAYELGYHYYVDKGFTVGADVALVDFDEGHAWSYGVNSKKLFSFEKDRWLVLDGGFGWANSGSEGDWTLDALATYYPTAKTGFGIGTTTTDRFSDFDTVLTATHYFKENLALTLSYNRGILKHQADTDGVSFGGKLRF